MGDLASAGSRASDPAELDESRLLAEAEAQTGLRHWGEDDSFRVGLGVLIAAIEERRPSAQAREIARAQILQLLGTRLRLADDAKRHPEILESRIERPLVIVGMPRTGTTILYDLLALAPDARAPRQWELAAPWPAPEAASFEGDPRIAQLDAQFAAWLAIAPELATMLPFEASAAGECNVAIAYHFAGPQFSSTVDAPAHDRWLAEKRAPGVYRTHQRILQQLQWKGPRGRWTLKSPGHLFDLEGLLEAYPDACLVWTHRDPAVSFASLTSMMAAFRRLAGLDAEPRAVAQSMARLWSAALERGTQSRRNPRVEAAILDVAYRDVVADPAGIVRRIHAHFDLAFGAEHAARIERHMALHPQHRHGRHVYSSAELDTGSDLHGRFPGYALRFRGFFETPEPRAR